MILDFNDPLSIRLADRGESVQGNPLPLGMERQPGENRAAHRARLKAERRARNDRREQIEAAQRERMNAKFAGRAKTPATADFDLPAASDEIDHIAGAGNPIR